MNSEHKVTHHHVRAIRGRMALLGITVRELAKRTGVSTTTVHNILSGLQTTTRHLPALLGALDMDPDITGDDLRLELDFINAIRRILVMGEPEQMRLVIAVWRAMNTTMEASNDNEGTRTPSP